jgi:hypothetical protein
LDLDLSSEQTLLLDAIKPLLEQHSRLPDPGEPVYFSYGDALDKDLADAGYYGDSDGFGLERSDAALVLEQVAQSPFAVPAMACLLVAPGLFAKPPPRPIALMRSLEPVPVRFLLQARTLLIAAEDEVLMLDLANVERVPVSTIFAYPYARLPTLLRSQAVKIEGASAGAFLDAWRLGLTCEMLGAMRAAHALTVDYVKQRVQFKRPIGAFQAVQHRLGEDATHIESVALLAARAAWSGQPGDIALAAAHAQKTAAQMIYDYHQFHGAIGLTLEYVLHHWTYRLKVLAGELGGSSAQARAAAQAIWGTSQQA